MKLILIYFSKFFGDQIKKLYSILMITMLLCFYSVTNVTASVYSQNDKISIQADDMKLRDLFREIENNSEYAFFFNDQFAQLDTKVSFVSKNEKIDHIMGRLLKDTQLDYKMLDNNFIVIVPKEASQELVIKGKITDATGAPIPGANVLEKGTNNGAVTDLDGNFSLRVLSSESVLVINFLGYLTEEIAVGNQTNIEVTMVENIETLNEVVVVGYGSMQRSNVTGSISTVKAEDLVKSPTPNAIEAMRGLIPGVRITRNSGQPGADVDITIRGVKSLGTTSDKNSSSYINPNSPLVVVDGVPIMGGKVSDINPNDIATMDILKDAAATSIYGSSASNGVVLITTKTGFSGKPTIAFNASTGFESFAMRPTLFNGEEYAQLKIDAATYQTRPSRYETNPIEPQTPQDVLDPYEYQNFLNGQDRDWIDFLTRTGRTNQYGLSITGGTEKFHYYMNGDIYNQKPVIPYTDYNRYSFRANADYNAYKWLTVGIKSQATLTNANETGTAFGPNGLADFSNYTSASPLGRSEDSLGNLVPTVNSDQFQYNPLYRYEHSEVKRKNTRISIEPFLEIKFFEGLTYRINGFAEFRNERWTRWLDGMYDPQNIGNNYYKMDLGQGKSYLCDNILNFNKTFLDKHSVNLTGVYGFQTNNQENFVFEVRQNMVNYLGIYDIVNADPFAENSPSTYNRDIYPTLSAKAYYVGRLVYSYDNRYVLTVSRRWDYTSQFGPNQRKGVFPSLAFAWNASNEKFIQNIPEISNLKLRLSYGEVGNDRIRQFSYQFTASNANYAFAGNSVSGWSSGQTGNLSLHWETSKQYNMGFDFGLFNNRLNGSFDYYRARNEGLLFEKQVPIIYGDQDPDPSKSGYVPSNVAETKSWGYELLLNGKILDGDLKWGMTINWSKDKNEIVNLGADNVDAEGNPIDDPANGWYIGQDINAVYDYSFQGIYQLADTAELRRLHPTKAYYWAGDPKIADIDGNDTINENDRTFQGSTVTPNWYGGISNTFSYKGFEFSFLFEAVQGIKKYNAFIPNPLSGIRANSIKVDYWMPDNPDGDFPRPRSGSYDYGQAPIRGVTSGNIVRLEDASFICLRTVSLSYTLPYKLTSKVRINGLTLYVRGNNLKYWTKMKQCFSPESDYGVFPVTRNITLGLTMTL